jgi:flagellar motor switch protein FliN/FliY
MTDEKKDENQTNAADSTTGNREFPKDETRPENSLDLSAVYDIPVNVTVVLGKSRMTINQMLKLGRGSVIELDKNVGDTVEIFINNRLIAKGEVIIVDNKIGITLTELCAEKAEVKS